MTLAYGAIYSAHGLTENDGHEIDGREIDGHENAGYEIDGHENDGHEIGGQDISFENRLQYNAVCNSFQNNGRIQVTAAR